MSTREIISIILTALTALIPMALLCWSVNVYGEEAVTAFIVRVAFGGVFILLLIVILIPLFCFIYDWLERFF